MKYLSTRGDERVTLDKALVEGIAPDGGLYMPEALPDFSPGEFDGATDIRGIAGVMLTPFFAESELEDELDGVLDETFRFPIPVTPLPGGRTSLLELYHGPTAAFKDVGARFLAATMARRPADDPGGNLRRHRRCGRCCL